VKLIVGLGNPGKEYQGTRHNVGFEVIDTLARRHGIRLRKRLCKALIGEGTIGGEHVTLAKPLTFMNLSGEAVAELAHRYRLETQDIIVITDDVNLPLGRLRIRTRGSSGGHKGLRSIIQSIGSEDFPRIRIGIGQPEQTNMVDFVLSRFSRSERRIVREAIERAADAVEVILAEGIEQAMNRFNALQPTPQYSGKNTLDTTQSM
jgi:PTH1 family peptidyl-tRNA hydrolase